MTSIERVIAKPVLARPIGQMTFRVDTALFREQQTDPPKSGGIADTGKVTETAVRGEGNGSRDCLDRSRLLPLSAQLMPKSADSCLIWAGVLR